MIAVELNGRLNTHTSTRAQVDGDEIAQTRNRVLKTMKFQEKRETGGMISILMEIKRV